MTLPIINTDLVLLDVDAGADKEAVIGQLVNRLADAGRTTDSEGLIAAAMAREAQSATGLPAALPFRTAGRRTSTPPRSGFARLQPAVNWRTRRPGRPRLPDRRPGIGAAPSMKLLSSLARALVRKDFVESLRNASTPRQESSDWSTA